MCSRGPAPVRVSRVGRLLAGATVALALASGASAQSGRTLAREEILLYGLGLRVEPAHQTVPRDIATIVSAFLQAPQLPAGTPAPFAAGAEVRATLRGPSFAAPRDLVARPNAPFDIPPLTVAGTHTLENIRLVSGGEVLLRGTPESVRIEVIDQLLVTQVTARPLTADEIREQGIVFDQSSFQAFNFTAAFAIDGGSGSIDVGFPVVLPTLGGAADILPTEVSLDRITPPALRNVQALIPDTLRIQAQIPNLSVVGFTLKTPRVQGQNFFVPPIPGVIVIPGDIGFLNQFFSVMLMVGNVAPAGSSLTVRDLTASIVLPAGVDSVVGTPDDPLRMAQRAAGESPRVRLVGRPGADGELGTADDLVTLGPGETGNAEFLVEGRREGTHVVEMQLSGFLEGLPVGPVPITGRAAGAVLVRNPSFTLTFTHPDTVVAGEPYTLDVTVSNTSASPANFVSVNLHPRDVIGATLSGEPSRSIDAIPPGDSASVTFDLVAQATGRVTAATLDADGNLAGRFQLKHAVGELGVPLSPDSLVLPAEAGALPRSLREAALGLLGKAWAVATAPAAALPADLERFSKQLVLDRAVNLAQAGARHSLRSAIGDAQASLGEAAADLLMDFAGSGFTRIGDRLTLPRDAELLSLIQRDYRGFDLLRRRSLRGDVFAGAIGALLADRMSLASAGAFHAGLAAQWTSRPGHVSVLVTGAGGGATPVDLVVVDGSGRRLGGVDQGKAVKEVPYGEFLALGAAGQVSPGQIAVIAVPESGDFTIRLALRPGAAAEAPFTLSVVFPGADGRLRQVVFDAVGGNQIPAITSGSADPFRFAVERYADGARQAGAPVPPTAEPAVTDPAPTVLGVVQVAGADLIGGCGGEAGEVAGGRIVAVLFSEEVTSASVQDRARAEAITAFRPEANRAVAVALQPGGRVAYVALREPIGPFVPRSMTIEGAEDRAGQSMAAVTLPIHATVPPTAGVVSGRILQSDGTPIGGASVRLFYEFACPDGLVTVGIAEKQADASGQYSWDYVAMGPRVKLLAVDPATETPQPLRLSVSRGGQRVNADLVFLGRGTIQGRALREDGRTPAPQTSIRITSLTDQSQYGALTDESGAFVIARIPVGQVLIEAVNAPLRATRTLSELVPFGGATVTRDLILLDQPLGGPAATTSGAVTGRVLRADGFTPVGGVPVFAFYQSLSQPGVACPAAGAECAVATATTDPAGAFAFAQVPSGDYRMYAVDQGGLAQGDTRLVVPANATADFNLLVAGGLATVRGVVLDAAGRPVPDAVVGGGLSLVNAGPDGTFVLTDVPVGQRPLVAVSAALAARATTLVDIVRAGEVVNVTLVFEATASVSGQVRDANGIAPAPGITVYVLSELPGGGIGVPGQAVTDANGGFRIENLPLGEYTLSAFRADFSDGAIVPFSLRVNRQVLRRDLVFRGGSGRVTGRVLAADGVTPLAGRASISGDQVVIAGGRVGVRFEFVQNHRIVDVGLDGSFAFDGVWTGRFTLRAAGQFSPDPIAFDATMPGAGQTVSVDLRLQPTSEIAGRLFRPDGVTPVAANVAVRYRSNAVVVFCAETPDGESSCQTIPQGIQEATVVTNDRGEFLFPLVNAGPFTLTADDGSGRSGEVRGTARAGDRATLDFRLGGLGTITVNVLGSDARTPVPGARVAIRQLQHPYLDRTVTADNAGSVTLTDQFGEGPFVVSATDLGAGANGVGRASGRIAQDGDHAVVNVYLYDGQGSVLGVVRRADGTPVPNAQVTLSTSGGPIAFSVTSAEGQFREDHLPLGPITVEVFEAATAARGQASGRLDFPGQSLTSDVTLDALGLLGGTLVEAGSLAPLKGWDVSLTLTSASGRSTTLHTTTGADGGYTFPGATVGTFQVTASKSGIVGSASAQGSISRGGQLVDVPLVAAIVRTVTGRIAGTVANPDGTPASNAQVALRFPAMTTTVAPDGTFAFEAVPLGRFQVEALAQGAGGKGTFTGEVMFEGETADAPMTLSGTATISGTVFRGDGVTPASNVEVALCQPYGPCQVPRMMGVDAQGRFTFLDASAGAFVVTARELVGQGGLGGAVRDSVLPGASADIRVVLETTGRLRGRVRLANGTAASGAVGELRFGSRRFFAESAPDGQLLFESVPLAGYTLDITDPIGPGVARRVGAVTGDIDLGDIILDEVPPSVVSVSPAPASAGVQLRPTVTVTFSEPVDLGTITTDTLAFSGPAGPVLGILQAANDVAFTLTPIGDLAPETRYSIRVSGVRDRLGKAMSREYVATFTTIDIQAPSVAETTPAAGASGAPVSTTIRVKYSEMIDPSAAQGAPVVLIGPAGAVAGRIDYLFGNTVVVLSPSRPLDENAVYRVQAPPAIDMAGNRQAQALDFTFSTTDRTPPQVVALVPSGAGTVVENTTTEVTADVGPQSDVLLVDFYINGVLAFTDRTAPYAIAFRATPDYGRPGDHIQVSAVATDTSGNRGTAAATASVGVVADQPPTAVLTSPAPGLSAPNGDIVTVTLRASDDVGVAQVGYRAATGRPQDASTRVLDPAPRERIETFQFAVPAGARPGSSIAIEASVVDTKGQAVSAAAASVTVLDGTAPSVSITGATTGDRVRPGQLVTALVAASDSGGVAAVGFAASGVLTATEVRAVSPAQDSVVTSFSFRVPESAPSTGRVLVDAYAVDRAGNRADAARLILPVADQARPTVQARTESGRSEIVAGRPFTLIVHATDEVAVASISVTGTGAFTVDRSTQVSPPAPGADASFVVEVPAGLAPGAVLELAARATDLSGNVSVPAVMTLTVVAVGDVTLPASLVVAAGESADLSVTIGAPAPAGGLVVALLSANPGVASVPSSVDFAAGDTSRTVGVTGVAGGTTSIAALVQGVERASTTVTVRGGIVRGTITDQALQPVPGAQVSVGYGGGSLTTTSDGAGRYAVEGVVGTAVSVRARSLDNTLLGEVSASLNAAGGFAVIDVVLLPAGSIEGTVFRADGLTPSGAGVEVTLYEKRAGRTLVDSRFTDDGGRFLFPLAAPGAYDIDAADASGNRGRAAVTLASGQQATVAVSFLGRGTVTGVVRSAAGTLVANANLTFTATSTFGSAPPVTGTSGADGRFTFTGVLAGSFTVGATDPISQQGGAATGSITQDGQTVDTLVSLAPYGHLRGTVFRSDGVTPVGPGVSVSIQCWGGYYYGWCGAGVVSPTATDDRGGYSFGYLPLGGATVNVSDPATRAVGRADVSLSANGETAVADVTLAPQGALVVTVNDGGGVPAPGASVQVYAYQGSFSDAISGTTGADGRIVFQRVLAGWANVYVSRVSLQAQAQVTIAPDTSTAVVLALPPTGTIQGRVFMPDGVTPVTGGYVRIDAGNSYASPAYLTDGTFSFTEVPVGSHSLVVYDASSRRRAVAEGLQLTQHGQLLSADLTMVGTGTVTGRVTMPEGTGAPNLWVTLTSLNPTTGGEFYAYTDAAGFYTIEGVPAGGLRAQVTEWSRSLIGTAFGRLPADGATVTLNIGLDLNAVTMPVNLRDANDSPYQVQAGGSLLGGVGNVLLFGNTTLDVLVGGAPTRFSGDPIGTFEDNRQEIAVRQEDVGVQGLSVVRKVYVPETGYFARYLELVTNNTPSPLTIGLRVTSQVYEGGGAPITATSSGDLALQGAGAANPDRWVAVDDGQDGDAYYLGGRVPMAFVFDGPGGGLGATTLDLAPSGTYRSLTYGWSPVTIPAGGTVALLHFFSQQTTQANARATAERLVQLPPEALAGLAPEELSAIRNFAVPPGGAGTLEPLPPLTGVVSGRVVDGDGVTPLPTARVTFVSQIPYYGREWPVTVSPVDASFSLVGTITTTPTQTVRRPVPVAPFTLRISYPTGVAPTTTLPGSFAPGTTEVTAEARMQVGQVTGTITRPDGTPWASRGFTLLSANPGFTTPIQAATDAQGAYAITRVPLGGFTISIADLSGGLSGGAAGTVASPGAVVVASIQLAANLVTLPREVSDGNRLTYRIRSNGRLESGLFFGGSVSSSYRGALGLRLVQGSSTFEIPDTGSGTALTELNGRQFILQRTLAGLSVTRKVFVPANGYFARYLDILDNPGATPVTLDVAMAGTVYIGPSYSPQGRIIGTSSGDATFDVSDPQNPDRWLIVDDGTDYDPLQSRDYGSAALVFDGPGAPRRAGVVRFAPMSYPWDLAEVDWRWPNVTVPPGGRVAFLNFAALPSSRQAAQAAAERLVQGPPEAFEGLTAAELAAIVNFAVPPDGQGPLAPLDARRVTFTGAFLKHDGATPLTGANYLRVNGTHPLYRSVESSFGPTFSMTATVVGGQYSLDTWNNPPSPFFQPAWRSDGPTVTGTLAAGQTAVARDIAYTTTGSLRGCVTMANGTPVPGGTLSFSWVPAVYGAASLPPDRCFSFPSVAPRTASASILFGGITGTAAFTITAGQETVANVVLPPVATLVVTALTARGTPIAGALVVTDGGLGGPANASGVASFPVPAGTHTVTVRDPGEPKRTGAITGVQITAAQDQQQVPITVQARAVASLGIGVRRSDGTPVRGASVELQDADSGGSLVLRGATGVDGTLLIGSVPQGPFTLSVTSPSAPVVIATTSGEVAAGDDGGTMPVALTVAAVTARVRGSLLAADGATSIPDAVEVTAYAATTGALRGTTIATGGAYSFETDLGAPGESIRLVAMVQNVGAAVTVQTITLEPAPGEQVVDLTLPVSVVKGRVLLGTGGAPTPGAWVEIADPTGLYLADQRAQADGSFAFLGAPAGPVILTVRDSDGFLAARRVRTMPAADGVIAIDILRTVVSGTVTFFDGTAVPYPDVRVEQTDAAGIVTTYFPDFTTDTGAFEVSGFDEGPMTLIAGTSGLVGSAAATLAPGETTLSGVDVRLEPTGSVSGTVTSAAGAPVAFAQVAITTAAIVRYTNADINGAFSFDLVPLGAFTVHAADLEITGFRASAGGELTVPTQAVPVLLRLPSTGTIEGTVTLRDGQPAAGLSVMIEDASGANPFGRFRRYATTDAAGHYSASNLPAGSSPGDPVGRLRVTAEGWPDVGRSEGEAVAGVTTRIDVTMGTATYLGRSFTTQDGRFEYYLWGDGRMDAWAGAEQTILRNSMGASPDPPFNAPSGYVASAETVGTSDLQVTLDGAYSGAASVRYRRKVLVSVEGNFVRYLETFVNEGDNPVRVRPLTVSGWYNNGPDTTFVVDQWSTGQTYAVRGSASGRQEFALHVFRGAGAPLDTWNADFANQGGGFSYTWAYTDVAPGETIAFMHFVAIDTDQAAAESRARSLADLSDPRAFAGMTAAERAAVKNFVVR